MGQKVNPHGLRVGVIKDWDSRWFTSKREFGDTLVEDYKIRKVLKKQLYNAGVPKIEIERTIDNATSKPRIRVTIHCAKPGMVIGRQGEQGGIVKAEGAMYASKVMPVCPKCGKATRVGHTEKDGKKVRVCKKCGAEF